MSTEMDKSQQEALSKTSYDVLPVSFRLIVLDTSLLVKKSLTILLQYGIVSAPLWNSKTLRFAGLLTASDYINVIQYYFQNPDKVDRLDHLTLENLREIEKAVGADPPTTLSTHPFKTLHEACVKMANSNARRVPLIDVDPDNGREIVVSVLTQYRILKFVALNCKETRMLVKPLGAIKIGAYTNLETAFMETPVFNVIQQMVKRKISSIPIVDADNKLLNNYEAVDVLTLVKGGAYTDLNLSVGEALLRRPDDFEGVHTCTLHDKLDTIMDTVRRSKLHRLLVIDDCGRLEGVVTLSDVLSYILYGEQDTT